MLHVTRRFQNVMIVKMNDLVDTLDILEWRSSQNDVALNLVALSYHSS